jgi:GT2 family glycosyltransferase
MKVVPKVAVVFATMNRSATALACVRALAAQTEPPALVVVADNVSTDDTAESLLTLRELPFRFILHRMAENRGNAGGVEEAMEIAFAEGVDAVWILDDDSWPHPEALAAMLEEPYDDSVILHPIQIDPASGRFTWPLQILCDGKWQLASSVEDMPPGKRTRSRGVWTGALVSRRIREAIGPVCGELFIRGEDEEYPWRMESSGFHHAAVRAAVLDHPGPKSLVMISFLGKCLFFEKGLTDLKLHYKVRNMVWLKRRQSGGLKAILTALAYTVTALRFEGVARLPLVGRAALEGWRGKLGRIS